MWANNIRFVSTSLVHSWSPTHCRVGEPRLFTFVKMREITVSANLKNKLEITEFYIVNKIVIFYILVYRSSFIL